jgi:hypothetical protein
MKFRIESLEADNPVLEVKFSDGKINQINFKEFLSRSSRPEICKYLDQDLFSTFEVKDGNVIWNDYN